MVGQINSASLNAILANLDSGSTTSQAVPFQQAAVASPLPAPLPASEADFLAGLGLGGSLGGALDVSSLPAPNYSLSSAAGQAQRIVSGSMQAMPDLRLSIPRDHLLGGSVQGQYDTKEQLENFKGTNGITVEVTEPLDQKTPASLMMELLMGQMGGPGNSQGKGKAKGLNKLGGDSLPMMLMVMMMMMMQNQATPSAQ